MGGGRRELGGGLVGTVVAVGGAATSFAWSDHPRGSVLRVSTNVGCATSQPTDDPSFLLLPRGGLSLCLGLFPSVSPQIDAQGMDFDIVVGGGDAVKRVNRLQAEVDTGHSDYVGVRNNLKADWLPHMARLGFELERVVAPGKRETQAIFRRKGVAPAAAPARV